MKLATCLLLIALPAIAEPVPYGGETVSFRPLPAVTDPHPLNLHVRYAGGYELVAHGTSQLDGLSDLQLLRDGDGFTVEAESDLGAVATFSLHPDGKGGLRDSSLRIDLIRDEDGRTSIDRTWNDAEDMAVDPATGERFLSFERVQRVMAWAPGTAWAGAPRRLPLSGLPVFPDNEGMEGLAFLNDAEGKGLLIGVESGGFWRCGMNDYACREVQAPPPPGFLYMLTSLTVLPDRPDDILALYRYYDPFNGPRNILVHLRLEGNRLVKVEDMAKTAPPLPYDNYEGAAAMKTAGGYRLYLICDGLHDTDKPKILIYDWDGQ